MIGFGRLANTSCETSNPMRPLCLGLMLFVCWLVPDVALAQIPVKSEYPSSDELEADLKEIGGSSIFLVRVENSRGKRLALYMASPWEQPMEKTAYVFAQIEQPSGRVYVLDTGVMGRSPDNTSLSRFRYDPERGVVIYMDDYSNVLLEEQVTLR